MSRDGFEHFAAVGQALEGCCWPLGLTGGIFGNTDWDVEGSWPGHSGFAGGRDGCVGFGDTDDCDGSKLADVGGNQCFRSDQILLGPEFGEVVSSSWSRIVWLHRKV